MRLRGISFFEKKPDIEALERNGDIDRLIRLLSYPDDIIQWKAAEALIRMGKPAAIKLIEQTHHPNRAIRIGIIETLTEMREGEAARKLMDLLVHDESIEVRWASAIALGEIGDKTDRADPSPEPGNSYRDYRDPNRDAGTGSGQETDGPPRA